MTITTILLLCDNCYHSWVSPQRPPHVGRARVEPCPCTEEHQEMSKVFLWRELAALQGGDSAFNETTFTFVLATVLSCPWRNEHSLHSELKATWSVPVFFWSGGELLYWVSRAAITKHHKLGAKNNRNVYPRSSGGWSLQSRHRQGGSKVLREDMLHACLRFCWLPASACMPELVTGQLLSLPPWPHDLLPCLCLCLHFLIRTPVL